jgi:effector-binding domain-containing protein
LNYLNRIAIVTALCLLIGAIVSLFLPSELELKKSTIIDADKAVVQKQLKTFRYQKISNYSLVEENESWEFIHSDKGLEVVSRVKFLFGFNPVTKFCAIFEEEKIDQEFQRKFDSLKIVLEELPKIQGVAVAKEMLKKDIWFLSIRDTLNQMNMNNAHGKFYEEINQFLITKDLDVSEPPLVIYHSWSDTLVDIEVGVSIDDSTMSGNGRIKMNKIEKSNVVTAVHYGAYERLPETYFGINEWMRSNKVVVIGPPWEIYLTDPSSESDPKKWETAIFFPIK